MLMSPNYRAINKYLFKISIFTQLTKDPLPDFGI